jgi:ankyrin repeat protein
MSSSINAIAMMNNADKKSEVVVYESTDYSVAAIRSRALELDDDEKLTYDEINYQFITACGLGHADGMKVLLNLGASVDGDYDNINTPLEEACVAGRIDIVDALINTYGARINDRDVASLLYHACQHNNREMIKYILSIGAPSGAKYNASPSDLK